MLVCRAFIGILVLSVFVMHNAKAEDLGRRGQVFKIEEKPFQEMIQERLLGVDIEKAQEEMLEIAKSRVENPEPVSGVLRADEGRLFYFDPSYSLDEDVVLPCGRVLYPAGTRVNPLDHMDLARKIFFVDARDEGQVEWLKQSLKEEPEENRREIEELENRVILVGGSVISMQEKLDMEVYFDQHDGYLAKLWGIEAVPAIVTQEGNLLRIEEVKI